MVALHRPLFEHLNTLARLPIDYCIQKGSEVTIPGSGHPPLNILVDEKWKHGGRKRFASSDILNDTLRSVYLA
jgi:hypothetical protein